MKCPSCRKAELDTRRENYRYDESGLADVVLHDLEVSRCPNCGEVLAHIPRMANLHRSIALVLLKKTGKLAPTEIRYLRKSLGWSGADFARHLHVDPSTVSRWENEKSPQPMDDGNEIALRLAVAHGEQIDEYEIGELPHIAQGEAAPVHIKLRAGKSGWTSEEQAA